MKGIILAGGSGTRLYPITQALSKQLLPVYDKPMIYYPLSVLMLAGIKDILIITTPEDNSMFVRLLRDGSHLGINITYAIQEKPEGLAQAFVIGEEFIGNDDVCLILGDNIFHGQGLSDLLKNSISRLKTSKLATVFGYQVRDPERYGVAGFDEFGNVTSIEEKPKSPKSSFAVVGLYFYPNDVIHLAKNISKSDRGEYEITTINQEYLMQKRLKVELMGRGYAWLDTGTHESLLEAGMFIQTIEHRQGLKIACLEEIAYELGYITKAELYQLGQPLSKNQYGQYLLRIAQES